VPPAAGNAAAQEGSRTMDKVTSSRPDPTETVQRIVGIAAILIVAAMIFLAISHRLTTMMAEFSSLGMFFIAAGGLLLFIIVSLVRKAGNYGPADHHR
jgi:uncharacterized membrane protein